jgi:hypothetical protein
VDVGHVISNVERLLDNEVERQQRVPGDRLENMAKALCFTRRKIPAQHTTVTAIFPPSGGAAVVESDLLLRVESCREVERNLWQAALYRPRLPASGIATEASTRRPSDGGSPMAHPQKTSSGMAPDDKNISKRRVMRMRSSFTSYGYTVNNNKGTGDATWRYLHDGLQGCRIKIFVNARMRQFGNST